MVNKKELLRCSLSVCLVIMVWENSCAMGQEVPHVAVLDDTHILTMTRTRLDPKLSSMRWGYSIARGMRFSAYDLSSIYIILAITLTLTISRCQ